MSQNVVDPYEQMTSSSPYGGGAAMMSSVNSQNMYQHQQFAGMEFQPQRYQQQQQQQYAQQPHQMPTTTPYHISSAAPQRGGSDVMQQMPQQQQQQQLASQMSSMSVSKASSPQMTSTSQAAVKSSSTSNGVTSNAQQKETSAKSAVNYTIIEQPVKAPRDRGMAHNEETIHVTRFALQWGGKLGEVFSTPFSIDDRELKNYFRTGVKNVDKLLGNIGGGGGDSKKDNAVILGNIFIGRVKVMYASTSFKNVPLAIIANDPIEDWNHIFRPGTAESKAIAIISHKNSVTPAHEQLAIDKIAVVESKTFLTFGHVSSADFENDIEYLEDDDKYAYVSTTSVLNQIIIDNHDVFMSQCNWDGKMYQVGDRSRCRYPFEVVAEAMVQYRFQIDPLRKKCGIYDFSHGISFSVTPAFDSGDQTIGSVYNNGTKTQMLSQEGVIEVQLEVTFTFPRSAYGRYLEGKVERETPRDKFFSVLNNSLQKYSSVQMVGGGGNNNSNGNTSNSSNRYK